MDRRQSMNKVGQGYSSIKQGGKVEMHSRIELTSDNEAEARVQRQYEVSEAKCLLCLRDLAKQQYLEQNKSDREYSRDDEDANEG